MTFSVGDRIPADIRLVTAVSLEIDESALTGETRPSKKNIEMCEKGEGEDTHGEGGGKALGERHCMAFMGTLVRSGELHNSSAIPIGIVPLFEGCLEDFVADTSRAWIWNRCGYRQRYRIRCRL